MFVIRRAFRSQGTISTAEKAKQALDSLDSISVACDKVSNMAAQIATATEQQAQVAQDISQNLTILAEHTNDNFKVVTENGNQANSTMLLATQLSDSVERFKLE